MASNNIEGTVTDSNGNTLQDAVIALFLTNKNASDGDELTVKYTRTDSNGNYVINNHPDADNSSKEWHVAGYYEDNNGEFNALSKPSVEASFGPIIPDSVVTRIDGRSITTSTTPNQVDDVVDSNPFDINGAKIGSLGGRNNVLIPEASSSNAFAIPSSRIGSNLNLRGGNWTILAVVYYDGTVARLDSDGSLSQNYTGMTEVSDNGNAGLWVDSNKDNDPVTWYDSGNFAETGSLTPNTFHLTAATYDAVNNNLAVYLDDPLNNGSKSTTNYSGTSQDWSNDIITIGSKFNGGQTVNGGLPVVEYHNELLSDQDISDAYSRLI